MNDMNTPADQHFTTDELRAAFRESRLIYKGWGFLRALNTPAVRISLEGMALAKRKKEQQSSTEMEAA
jgi:hypothetical protein